MIIAMSQMFNSETQLAESSRMMNKFEDEVEVEQQHYCNY
jgi:hypothetical protein